MSGRLAVATEEEVMASSEECARVATALRILLKYECAEKKGHYVFEKPGDLGLRLDGLLIYRDTNQNTTPVVIAIQEGEKRLTLRVRYLEKPGTFAECTVDATLEEITKLGQLVKLALSNP